MSDKVTSKHTIEVTIEWNLDPNREPYHRCLPPWWPGERGTLAEFWASTEQLAALGIVKPTPPKPKYVPKLGDIVRCLSAPPKDELGVVVHVDEECEGGFRVLCRWGSNIGQWSKPGLEWELVGRVVEA